MHLHFGLDRFGLEILIAGALFSFFASIFWKPQIGLWFLIPLLPLQTGRYRLLAVPLGAQFVDIMMLGVLIGLAIRGQLVFRTPWTKLLLIIGIYTYVSLWQGSLLNHFELPLWFNDPRVSNWKNFMDLLLLFVLVVSAVRTKRDMRILVFVMCLGVLVLNRQFKQNSIESRDFSSFSYVGREAGNMGYAGVNGLAAFEVQYCLFVWALALAEKKLAIKLAGFGVAAFCCYCMLYSLSRGAYVAFVVGFLYLALTKSRILIPVFCVCGLMWQSLVPGAVRERVMMTYKGDDLAGSGELDNSAAERVELWTDAMQLVKENFVIGSGFNTYAFMGRVGGFRDTHNLYVKFLVEYGFAGTLLFLYLFLKFYWHGRRLYRKSADPFLSALGFGFSAYVVALLIVNCFGDRWYYVQISGYTWVLAALVTRGLMLEEEEKEAAPVLQAPVHPWAVAVPARTA